MWNVFHQHFHWFESIGFGIDVSGIVDFASARSACPLSTIIQDVKKIEQGEQVNTDEGRQVGHYWLRHADIAPNDSIKKEIGDVLSQIHTFSQKIHEGEICGQSGKFENVLCIGIGGSALGPQLASKALQSKNNKMQLYFLDNTDPDGMDMLYDRLCNDLGKTLVLVTSKSGGTPETRNGMLEVQNWYQQHQLKFEKHAVAITCIGSKLDQLAETEQWLSRFPMWEWVGGRTSISSVVGLLPMALQGIDYLSFLRGMKDMDELTRSEEESTNPAYMLSLAWYAATNGKGEKDMVILPYKDRLSLLSAFLQQLIMESIGKKFDRDGKEVYQGITVYGNKGSTDQHAYVQQLRDGVNNFFVTFIEVMSDRQGSSIDIEKDIHTGDYLEGFFLGTRRALSDAGRETITLTIREVNAYYLGLLIALYERAVGMYASMINVNAYHQPGVEAGKKAAGDILLLQQQLLNFLRMHAHRSWTVEEISESLHVDDCVTIFKLLEHLSANHRLKRVYKDNIFSCLYQAL